MDIIIRDGQPLTQDANGGMHRSSITELVAEIQQLRTRIVELESSTQLTRIAVKGPGNVS